MVTRSLADKKCFAFSLSGPITQFHPGCGYCYGASNGCCKTCIDVKVANQLKNWDFNPSLIEQCTGKQKKSKKSKKLIMFKKSVAVYCICGVLIIMVILIFIAVVYKIIQKSYRRSSQFNVTSENLEINTISISN